MPQSFPSRSFPSKFQVAAGIHVTRLDGVAEGYAVQTTDKGYSVIRVNISADKLQEIYLGLCALVITPAFAIVELPMSAENERMLREKDTEPFHKDVYYLNGISFDDYQSIFLEYSQFFIDDGLINFGFASHTAMNEVFVGQYKLVNIYADTPVKFLQYLEAQNYPRREPLRTVVDNLSPQSPGIVSSVKVNGKTIYDLIEVLKQKGFKYAETRAAGS